MSSHDLGLNPINTPYNKAVKFAKGLNQTLQGLELTHVQMWATFESLVETTLM